MAEGENKKFKPGNTDENGNYKVGKGRPPENGKFRAGDGRKRGRRKKGTKNLATDFSEELASKVTMKVDGKPRRVTKQRAIMMRLMDNASRGQNSAIKTIMTYAENFGIEVQLESPKSEELIEFPNMKDLTEYEFDLLTQLIEKASGRSFGNDKLYDDDHPLAYLEDPDDPRGYFFDNTIEGVSWKRFHASRFEDFIFDIASNAYHSAAGPRRPLPVQRSLENCDAA